MEIIKPQDRIFRQLVHHAEQVGNHHPQPGAAAFAERHHHDVGTLQFVELLDTAQLALRLENVGFGLASHTPVQPLAGKFLAGGLQPLAQVLEREIHTCSPV